MLHIIDQVMGLVFVQEYTKINNFGKKMWSKTMKKTNQLP